MAKKQAIYKTKGMNRDLSVSAFNPEFSFENVNLRLITNEGNTTMSWVNEKGTLRVAHIRINTTPWRNTTETEVSSLLGVPLGTAVINSTLIVFTSNKEANGRGYDYIYCIDNIKDGAEDAVSGYQIYKGNLNFSLEHPIETLVSYEAEYIQKVYWTDGYNQPRVINIKAAKDKIKVWNHDGSYSDTALVDTFFDFVPSLKLTDSVAISQNTGAGGMFAPGVIQYVITYINKYGQQSNIAYTSPLYYLAHADRGASPEEKVGTNFSITVSKADLNFDYVRIYSVQRTSMDAIPIVKILDDLPIIPNEGIAKDIILVDNGTTGTSVDPTELLFVGGKEITAYTMTDKDNTLFLGNIVQKNGSVNAIQDKIDELRKDNSLPIEFVEDAFFGDTAPIKRYDRKTPHGTYDYDCQLNRNQEEITTFKGGEWYRFGFQLQKVTGEWTEPIFLKDVQNPLYPKTAVYPTTINGSNYYRVGLPYARMREFDISTIAKIVPDFYNTYKKIRPVTVFPTIGDRNVICQGVLNPTVFNAIDRIDNAPFAQASWYYRPYTIEQLDTTGGTEEIKYPRISVSKNQTTPDVNPDSNFNEYKTVYGIRIHFDTGDYPNVWENVLDTIGVNGYISPGFDLTNVTAEHLPFLGIVGTGRYIVNNRDSEVIFLTEKPYSIKELEVFKSPYYGNNNGVPEMLKDANGNHMRFNLYSNIAKDWHSFLYYAGDDSMPETYTLKFSIKTTSFSTNLFDNISAKFDRNEAIPKKDTETELVGSIIPFTHYDSLVTYEGKYDNKNWMDVAKQIEIQGAVKTYNTPYSTERNKDKNSNTQFFIDQSIVTLNSPDIEFDTEVQTCSGEGFKLRIVGAVPITASSSAHSFEISSSMMETWHNSFITDSIVFGTGEKEKNTRYTNEFTSTNVGNVLYAPQGGRRLVANYLWNDVKTSYKTYTSEDEPLTPETAISSGGETYDYLIHPWHRKGSLNNDYRAEAYASSMLRTKKESNLLYSSETEYF